MRTNYRVNATVQYSTLSPDQIEEIFSASLEVLERVGMRIHSDEAVDMLEAAGATVDGQGLVHIPGYLVKHALNLAPSRVVLAGRDGSRKVVLEKDRIYYGTGSDTPFFIDPRTDERRNTVYQDVYDAARTADALPNMDFFMSLGLVSDAPAKTYDRHQFLAMITGTSKPMVITAVDRQGLEDQHRMACAALGGEDAFRCNPLFAIYIEPISPLQHSKEVVEKLFYAADHGIPIVYTPAPTAGFTAPMTLAGIMTQGLAEMMAGLVMAQLRSPGAAVITGGVHTVIDMKTMIFSYGAPEFLLLSAALTDIMKWLGLPMFSTAGCSDAKVLDGQAALQAGLSIFLAALSGANLIHDVGYLESGLTGSLDMLVLSDEIIAMVKRILQGVPVTPDTLAVDVIADVGPGGHFISTEHTLRHFRHVLWQPELQERDDYAGWEAKGKKTLSDRVRAKVLRILETHQPAPISPDALKVMRAIVEEADQKYA